MVNLCNLVDFTCFEYYANNSTLFLLTLMLIIQWTGLGVIDRAEEASLNCTKEQKKYER